MVKPEKLSSVSALGELTKGLRSYVKRPNIYGYNPHLKQEEFHRAIEKIRLLIGGNRSGKTVGGIAEDVFRLRGQHPYQRVPEPPVRGRIVGVDFLNGVEQILKPELARWLPIGDLKGGSWYTAYDNQERELTLENGSTLQFRSYEQDTDKFAGVSLHFVHMDEEPPQPIYKECLARTIDTGGVLYLTLTPVEGMTWLYDEVYEPGQTKQNANIKVIVVDTTENPHLSAGEIDIFISTLTDEEREARIHGKYSERGGLIYKSFGEAHIIDEFDHKRNDLVIACSMDHGFNNPTAWLWFAVDSDERVVLFHEYYESGRTVDYHAEQVREINQRLKCYPEYSVGDPSIRNTDPITGTSILEEYSKYDVFIIPGNNDVSAGIVRVARFLKQSGDRPNLLVTKNCENTIREFRRYRWAKYASSKSQYQNNLRESPQKKDDHCMDALRYFIMSRPDLSFIGSDVAPRQPIPGLGSIAAEDVFVDHPSKPKTREEYVPIATTTGETQWMIYDNIEGTD